MLQPQVYYDIKTTNICAEHYLRRVTHMAHNTKKQQNKTYGKKQKEKKNKLRAKCNVCEAQGCWFCITLKNVSDSSKEKARGPEIRSDTGHHLKQHKTLKTLRHSEKSQGDFSVYFKWLHHEVGGVLWRIGEVWGDDSFSEEVEDVRVDCRWTVLWKSLLLIRTTGEKRRSWKWLKSGKRK